MAKRIVNIKYKCCGLNFDAAIDCDWKMHCYAQKRNDVTPIELYCFDRKEWDIRMIFQDNRNDDGKESWIINHTVVDWDLILKETRKWVREMKKTKNQKQIRL